MSESDLTSDARGPADGAAEPAAEAAAHPTGETTAGPDAVHSVEVALTVEPGAEPVADVADTAPTDDQPADAPAASTERMFAGRYRLIARRGSATDIAMFEAHDALTDRTVAVKIIHPDICERHGFADRFVAVMHDVARIRHPNVAEVLDVGVATWNGRPVNYAVCENLTGGSLRDLRDRGRMLTASQVVMIGLEACRGLDAAHRAGVVHGDIRPANVVFGDDGRLRLTDVGLAQVVAESWGDNPAGLTVERAKYASPEYATLESGISVSAKSDVYALCLCLLEAVTGQLPFVSESAVATLANRVDKLMPVSADLGPLAAVLERAGRPNPDDRSSAAEFGRALMQVAEKLPRPAPISLLGGGVATVGPFAAPVASVTGLAPGDSTLPAGTALPPVTPDQVADVVAAKVEAQVADLVAAASAPAAPGAPEGIGRADHASQPPAGVQSAPQPPQPPPPPPPRPDDAPPLLREPRSRRKLFGLVAVVILALAAGGALAVVLSRDATHTVPTLAGLERGEALNMISDNGWNILTVPEASDEIAPGVVIRSEPAMGTSIKEGRDITLYVSTGPAPRVLPELTGRTVTEAGADLTELALVPVEGERVFDEVILEGVVMSWTIVDQPGLVAGDTVVPGTEVVMTVSAGPQPRMVPDLSGLAPADATAALDGLGLVVAQLPDEFSPTMPIGAVVRQEPAPGTEVPRGATVSIVVSKGPDLVEIPPLADLNLQQATDALAAAGLAVGQVKGDPAGINILAEVAGVPIGANTVLPRGTAIDLTFAVPAPPPTAAPPG
jgi:eukaryotic-like serine/threonine-protein kinase